MLLCLPCLVSLSLYHMAVRCLAKLCPPTLISTGTSIHYHTNVYIQGEWIAASMGTKFEFPDVLGRENFGTSIVLTFFLSCLTAGNFNNFPSASVTAYWHGAKFPDIIHISPGFSPLDPGSFYFLKRILLLVRISFPVVKTSGYTLGPLVICFNPLRLIFL